ncbi:Uncharacterised protein [Leminorella richardii]|uniref:Uncharacterized protein n=1 Tax=Leminorella richardii TaxID=158841 RepID=A0A2X4URY1_9GAMM|nr:hypothetical protein [Leminorella richardii]SQI41613.1 Uncharacterised protein [Leminorella richardii]
MPTSVTPAPAVDERAQGYRFYYTHQFLRMMEEASARNVVSRGWVRQKILLDIGRYPCRGRLFLNRSATNSDNQRLRWQLAQRFESPELRELSDDGWLILYLNRLPSIYLLALMPLSVVGAAGLEDMWQGSE